MTGHPWVFTLSRRQLMVAAIALIALAGSYFVCVRYLTANSNLGLFSAEVPTLPATRLDVSSTTLRTNEDNDIRIKAFDKLDPSIGTVAVEIPELGIHEKLSAKELNDGREIKVNPSAAGFFEVRLMALGSEIASAPIAAVPSGEFRADEEPDLKLRTGPPRILQTGSLYAPVYITAVGTYEGKQVPMPVQRTIEFLLKDEQAGKFAPRILQIPKGQALSNTVSVDLTPSAKYELVATSSEGRKVGPHPVDWNTDGPRLVLAAYPPSQEVFATFVTKAKASVYLTFQGRKINPPVPVSVMPNCPGDVTIEPKELVLQPDTGVASCTCFSLGFARKAFVGFHEPIYSSNSTIDVVFLFPWLFYTVAIAAAAIASFTSLILSKQPSKGFSRRAIKRVTTGVLSGLALSFLLLAGWSGINVGGRFNFAIPVSVDPLNAAIVGLIGGFGPMQTFNRLKQLPALVMRFASRTFGRHGAAG